MGIPMNTGSIRVRIILLHIKSLTMKLLFAFFVLVASIHASAQTSQAPNKEQANAQFKAAIQSELSISPEKADAVIAIISSSNNQMANLAKDKSLNKSEKQKRFKSIANERDGLIAQQLTQDQIRRLTQFLINRRKNAPRK